MNNNVSEVQLSLEEMQGDIDILLELCNSGYEDKLSSIFDEALAGSYDASEQDSSSQSIHSLLQLDLPELAERLKLSSREDIDGILNNVAKVKNHQKSPVEVTEEFLAHSKWMQQSLETLQSCYRETQLNLKDRERIDKLIRNMESNG